MQLDQEKSKYLIQGAPHFPKRTLPDPVATTPLEMPWHATISKEFMDSKPRLFRASDGVNLCA